MIRDAGEAPIRRVLAMIASTALGTLQLVFWFLAMAFPGESSCDDVPGSRLYRMSDRSEPVLS